MQIEPPVEPELTPPPAPINPGAENPPWSGLDLLMIGLVLLAALFFFSGIFFLIALRSPHSPAVSAAELGQNPRPQVIVPAMTLAYAVMLGAMYVLVTRQRRRRFWEAVAWHWPGGSWPAYLFAGSVLAVGLGQLSRLLPVPKSLPMDRFFQDRQGAYLMMWFGVAVAPLAEEMLFRGFLYPVLDRWLETLFMFPLRIRTACFWLLALSGWGYLGHRLSLPWSLLATFLAALALGAVSVARGASAQRRLVLLPGAALVVWGLASRSIGQQAFGGVTMALFVGAGLLGVVSLARPLETSMAGLWGRLLAVLITSSGFALVHSEQLGRAWGPLLVLFLVGLVLTMTRVLTRSLAPGFLMHVGYNLALFTVLYVGTDHFRHLERMMQ